MSKWNEKKPGYKKTKVGWIPKGWECLPLKALCLRSGEYGANVSAIPYTRAHPRYVRITDIDEDGRLNKENMKSIDSKISKSYLLNEGDFLFARSGATVGKTYLHASNRQKCAYAGYLIRFVPNPQKLDGIYLKAFTSTQRYWNWVRTTSRAGAQPNINAKEYSLLNIPVPPLPQQKKIAEILSMWDRAIDQAEKLIEEKEKQKHWLSFQLLTSRSRLQGFTKPWKEYRLGELFNERAETGYQHLPLLSITREEGVIPRNDTDRKDTSSADKSRYFRICPGDIGYNTMRMWQGVSALSSLEGIVSPAYTVCTPKKGVDGEYMAYFFKLPKTIHLFYRYSQGLTSDTWNLKFRHFKEIKVPAPEYEEQREIVRIIRACDEEIRLWQNMVNLYRKQKCGLMQKLLSGQWRVRVAQ